MATKRSASPSTCDKAPKRLKKVMTLENKVKLLDMLREGTSYAAAGRHFHINESTVRYIKKSEEAIRKAVMENADAHAKMVSRTKTTIHDKFAARMETALSLWLEDNRRKDVPVNSIVIREKAKSLYAQFAQEEYEASSSTSDEKPAQEFRASKGWFDQFKKRFELQDFKITGRSSPVDQESVKSNPVCQHIKLLIEEKGYKPEQVFNASEIALFWKKMPTRTYISQEERRTPGFKASKDRLILLTCGNAAGHMIKPGLVYKAANPLALQNRNKNLLPVYWMYNNKALMTKHLFTDWFHKCFVPEVRHYLEDLQLEFNVLLILNNAPGHPDTFHYATDGIEIVFLPPSITSPMDQGISRTLKANYTCSMMQHIVESLTFGTRFTLEEYWKAFSIADSISILTNALSDLSPQTINVCWKNLWPGCVYGSEKFAPVQVQSDVVRNILSLAGVVGGEGFDDLEAWEVELLIDDHSAPLTDEDLEALTMSAAMEEEQDDMPTVMGIKEQEGLNLERLHNCIHSVRQVGESIFTWDPSMVRALKFQQELNAALLPYKNLLKDMRKKQQLPKFFQEGPSSNPQNTSVNSGSSTSLTISSDPIPNAIILAGNDISITTSPSLLWYSETNDNQSEASTSENDIKCFS